MIGEMFDKIPDRIFMPVVLLGLVLTYLSGWGCGYFNHGNATEPKPMTRHELLDESHHVIYSYETHDNLVLSQSPGLTLRTWKEVEK